MKLNLYTIAKNKNILCKSVDMERVVIFLELLNTDEEITIWKEEKKEVV